MSDRFCLASWDDQRAWLEIIAVADERPTADFLVLGSNVDASTLALIERATTAHPQTNLVVVCDPNDPVRRSSLTGELPPLVSLLAANPTDDPAVAVSIAGLREQATSAPDGIGLPGLTMKLAIAGNVHLIESDSSTAAPPRQRPSLTTTLSEAPATWLRDYFLSLSIPPLKLNSPNTIALRAGLLLLNDFGDESHSCSQSIEGHSHADYWHAILHRREPDYGNAKYWFRRVGRHDTFEELASRASSLLVQSTGPVAVKLDRWRSRLISTRGWDPAAFVDLCEAAVADSALRAWCEEVQFVEMLLLLTATYRAAVE